AKAGANVEVLDGILRFEDGAGAGAREERVFLAAKSTADAGAVAGAENKEVSDALLRAKDAAVTLAQIAAEREQAKQPDAAPSSAPGAIKATSRSKPEQPAPPRSASIRLREHDEAIRALQPY